MMRSIELKPRAVTGLRNKWGIRGGQRFAKQEHDGLNRNLVEE